MRSAVWAKRSRQSARKFRLLAATQISRTTRGLARSRTSAVAGMPGHHQRRRNRLMGRRCKRRLDRGGFECTPFLTGQRSGPSRWRESSTRSRFGACAGPDEGGDGVRKQNRHIGSSLNDFLRDEGILGRGTRGRHQRDRCVSNSAGNGEGEYHQARNGSKNENEPRRAGSTTRSGRRFRDASDLSPRRTCQRARTARSTCVSTYTVAKPSFSGTPLERNFSTCQAPVRESVMKVESQRLKKRTFTLHPAV
jgi:hypothetical protein